MNTLLRRKLNDVIEVPYLTHVKCVNYDEIPQFIEIEEAKQIIAESNYILQDINWQIRQKEANAAWDEIQYAGNQEELIKRRLKFHDWIAKASGVARSTTAKKFIYTEALRRAGIE